MTLFDWTIVGIIVVSAVIAMARGFLLEAISLGGLVLGLWLAFWNYRALATPISRAVHSPGAADALAFLLIAFGVMLVAALLARLLSRAASSLGLGGLDSLLGALFGVVRGYVFVLVAVVAIAAFFPNSRWMQGSRLAPWFLSAANGVSAGAPAELRLKIREGVDQLRSTGPRWIQYPLRGNTASR
jgi:membrane protein required for colicin V production